MSPTISVELQRTLTPLSVPLSLGFSDEAMKKLEKFRTKNNQIVPGSSKSKSKRSLAEEAFVAGKRSWA